MGKYDFQYQPPCLAVYVKDAFKNWLHDHNREPIIAPQLWLFATDDIRKKLKTSIVNKHMEVPMTRVASLSCRKVETNFNLGVFLMSFDAVYNLNTPDKAELSKSIKADIINKYNAILDFAECNCFDNLNDMIVVEMRKNIINVYVAMNNTGLVHVQHKQEVIDKKFRKILKL
ncbi:hypothetical protein [Amedibacillus sp. YH-ame10]